MRGYPMRILRTLALVSAKEATGPQNKNARLVISRAVRGRPGTATAVLLRMPDGPHRRGEGGGAYAYAPARHSSVFLFGRLRRWTRDRGCDLAHLILRFCRNKFFARSACVVDLMRLFFLGDAQAARLLIIRCLSILQQEKTPRRACCSPWRRDGSITPQDALRAKLIAR